MGVTPHRHSERSEESKTSIAPPNPYRPPPSFPCLTRGPTIPSPSMGEGEGGGDTHAIPSAAEESTSPQTFVLTWRWHVEVPL